MAFNEDESIRHLRKQEQEKEENREIQRKKTLGRVQEVLKEVFDGSDITIYLIGSILQKGKFHANSDIDIVLKGYSGDRFEVWSKLESLLDFSIEVIYYEEIDFQEDVEKLGLRVR